MDKTLTRREEILEAASWLFGSCGFEKTTVDAVAVVGQFTSGDFSGETLRTYAAKMIRLNLAGVGNTLL